MGTTSDARDWSAIGSGCQAKASASVGQFLAERRLPASHVERLESLPSSRNPGSDRHQWRGKSPRHLQVLHGQLPHGR